MTDTTSNLNLTKLPDWAIAEFDLEVARLNEIDPLPERNRLALIRGAVVKRARALKMWREMRAYERKAKGA